MGYLNKNLPTAMWDDMSFPLSRTYVNPTTSKPDYDNINLGLLFPQNDPSEKIDIICQLPHSWKEGTTISPHVHYIQTSTSQVVFRIDYKWYNLGEAVPVGWTTYEMNNNLYPYTSGAISQIVNGAGISGIGLKISSILKIKLYRVDNNQTGDVFTDQFDIHILKNTIGSEEIGIKY